MKPFVPWVGSKARCAKEIIDEFPSTFANYYEPFLGSGAVYFSLRKLSKLPAKALLSDINANLIGAYIAVLSDVERVKRVLLLCCSKNSEAYYYEMRRQIQNPSVFIYVMRAAFSSLYRENQKGEFNTPWRKQDFEVMKRVISHETESLDYAARYMASIETELKVSHWEAAISGAQAGDLIYCDPPYLTETNGFTSYSSGGFNDPDHVYLNNYLRVLKNKGCHVFLSNSVNDSTIRIFGKPTKEISMTESTRSTATTKGKRVEGLWVY